MLSDLRFEPDYASEEDDILASFYLPAMAESIRYDRITGFFASTVFTLAWPSLRRFVQTNEGRIRLLCSPRLTEPDAEGIVSGYRARTESELADELRSELQSLLAEPHLSRSALLLSCLIADGTLEVRLATVTAVADARSRRMVHDKVGLFADADGNRVGFRGTFNETFLGLSAQGNIESVDVWTSWDTGKDLQRLTDAEHRFKRIWDGEAPGITVTQLPAATLDEIRELAHTVSTDSLLAELEIATAPSVEPADEWMLAGRLLRPHQQEAVRAWRSNNCVGVVAHATGAGKTVTGMFCIREALQRGFHPIVIVPSALLLEQWDAEIRQTLDVRTILCGAGNDAWRAGHVRTALTDEAHRVVIAVANSAASPDFLRQVKNRTDNVMVLADEAHRLGSPEYRQLLDALPTPARLGLSATPERAGDPDGTAALFHYFDRTVDVFGIREAIGAGILTSYEYHPTFVELREEEQEQFDKLTARIRRLVAMSSGSKEPTDASHLKHLLIARSRIIKNAAEKPATAAALLQDRYRPGHRWLVYCDNQTQVNEVRQSLADRGIGSWEYYRGMPGDAANTLRAFSINGGIVVSIRCLDEGVDIPASDHALILASSRNPREHIQRRGRVLRRYPFKTVASLHDIITVPRDFDHTDSTIGTITGEMARALEFASWSLTRTAENVIREKWVSMGLELDSLPGAQAAGLEDDSEDD